MKMDKDLELYLITVEKYLKNMPVSERIDVIKELKSHIEELHLSNGRNAQGTLEKLGPPRELAAGYLSDQITVSHSFNLKRILMVFSFYGLTSLTGMFVIPCGTVMAGSLMLCGIMAPIAGLIDMLGFILGFDVPFVVMNIGGFVSHPLLAFPLAVVLGALLFLWGKITWKAVIGYIRKVSSTKRKLDGIV
jgi:uncharacterized membrane protein